MWNIIIIVFCVILVVISILFLPFSVTCLILLSMSGLALVHDLQLRANLSVLQIWLKSCLESIMNRKKLNSKPCLQNLNSNGILKSHSALIPNKTNSSSNLTPQTKLVNEPIISDIFKMSLNDCNRHSTPISVSGNGNYQCELVDNRRSSWSNMKSNQVHSNTAQRNVQTVAGPLLVSTRFNSNISSELSANVTSAGFSSRLAQKGNETATHQAKYSGIGVFPIVQLQSRSPKHSISARSTAASSKAVRVRIAPPDNSPLGGMDSAGFSNAADGEESVKSVLQVLKEISRKRIHSQVDEYGDEKVKRPKKDSIDENLSRSLDPGIQNKRGREDSPRSSEEVKRQRRHMNGTTRSNEIMSSLSSSISVKPPHLIKGTKRKAHAVDWSRCSTPVSGKVLKVNTSPYQEQACPTENQEVAKTSHNENAISSNETDGVMQDGGVLHSGDLKAAALEDNCVCVEAGSRRLLARAGHCQQIPVPASNSASDESEPVLLLSESEIASSPLLKSMNDPGKRLKDMLAAINGSDDVSPDEVSMSPNVVAILKSAKSSSTTVFENQCGSSYSVSPSSILKSSNNNDGHKSVSFAKPLATFQEFGNSSDTTTSSPPQTSLSTATLVSTSLNNSISSPEVTTNYSMGDTSSQFSLNKQTSFSSMSNEDASKSNIIQTSSISSASIQNVATSNSITNVQSFSPGTSLYETNTNQNNNSVSSSLQGEKTGANSLLSKPTSISKFGLSSNAFNKPTGFTDNKSFGSSDKQDTPVNPLFGMQNNSNDPLKSSNVSFFGNNSFNKTNESAPAPAAPPSSTAAEKPSTGLFNSANQQTFSFGNSTSGETFGSTSLAKATQSSSTQPSIFASGPGSASSSVSSITSNANPTPSSAFTMFNGSQGANTKSNENLNTASSLLTSGNFDAKQNASGSSMFGNKTVFGTPNAPAFGTAQSSSSISVNQPATTASSSIFSSPTTSLFGSKANDSSSSTSGAATALSGTSTLASSSSLFGATSTSAPAFGSSASNTSSFGASSGGVSTFGSNMGNTPAFGTATSSGQSGFGSKQEGLFAAAASNGAGTSAFGSLTTTASTFGTANSSSLFTAKSSSPFVASSASAPVFGAASSSLSSTGTAPTTTINSTGFGASNSSSSSSNIFGNNVSTSGFGSPSSTAFGGGNNAPAFGFNASSGFGNSSANSLQTKSVDSGAAASTAGQQLSFSQASPAFSFGGQSAAAAQNSAFNGASSVATTVANGIGGGFSAFGNATATNEDKSKASGFGSFPAPAAFSFGSQAATSGAFSFGSNSSNNNNATTAPSAGFSFPPKPTEQKTFAFGGSQSTSSTQPPPAFSFPQSASSSSGNIGGGGVINNNNSTQPGFQFNMTSNAQAPGPFVFGGIGENSSPGFGMNQPAFQLGAAAGGPAGASSGARFSIGSGSTVARSRAATRPKRTK